MLISKPNSWAIILSIKIMVVVAFYTSFVLIGFIKSIFLIIHTNSLIMNLNIKNCLLEKIKLFNKNRIKTLDNLFEKHNRKRSSP